MNNNTYIGETPDSGDTGSGFDWNAFLNTALQTAGAYFGNRPPRNQNRGSGGGTTIIQQGGMSSTTKALLIGGGILTAGLVVYAITKKK